MAVVHFHQALPPTIRYSAKTDSGYMVSEYDFTPSLLHHPKQLFTMHSRAKFNDTQKAQQSCCPEKNARDHSCSSRTSVANSQYSAFTVPTSRSVSSTTDCQPSRFLNDRRDMTIYYQYDKDGKPSTSADGLIVQGAGHLDVNHYLQQGDVVGAYLAQRDATYRRVHDPGLPEPVSVPGRHFAGQQLVYPNSSAMGPRHQNGKPDGSFQDQSRGWRGSISAVGADGSTHPQCPYPGLEAIRHLHTLYGLLPWINPGRRSCAMNGPSLDIVEQDTRAVLAHDVPKKLLVLFFGRDVVNKFLVTVGTRKDDQRHGQRIQKLSIPTGISSRSAMRILLAWLSRACYQRSLQSMRQFNVPHNFFAACTLAQTLTLFGLQKDAERVDQTIAKNHMKRPIFATEIEQLWNCLGPSNRYTYAAIKVVGKRYREYEHGNNKAIRNPDEIKSLMERFPNLGARIKDGNVNEQYRPSFSTAWCAGSDAQPNLFNGHPARHLRKSEQRGNGDLGTEAQRVLGRILVDPARPDVLCHYGEEARKHECKKHNGGR
ncbi:hypothetical protein ACEQ8H_005416 [Pleosporales sp. CAS-2024a]